jgi:hypothetical protein
MKGRSGSDQGLKLCSGLHGNQSLTENSLLDARLKAQTCFRDSYRVPISQPTATVSEIFCSVFGHHPAWMKAALIVRNRIAAVYGLDTPSTQEIMRPKVQLNYQIGDKIGPWPIFAISANEIIAGRDNKHLDFRISILKEPGVPIASTVISTVCDVHNRADFSEHFAKQDYEDNARR